MDKINRKYFGMIMPKNSINCYKLPEVSAKIKDFLAKTIMQ